MKYQLSAANLKAYYMSGLDMQEKEDDLDNRPDGWTDMTYRSSGVIVSSPLALHHCHPGQLQSNDQGHQDNLV